MAPSWATERTLALVRVSNGRTRFEKELSWSVQESIEHRSYLFPVTVRFSHAVALGLTNHRTESLQMLSLTREILSAYFMHDEDTGTSISASLQDSMFTYLYHCEWLLTGVRKQEYLEGALRALRTADTRAVDEGLELGEDGFEEMALLHLLLGNGSSALEVLPRATTSLVALDPAAVTQGAPTTIKTLGAAAHYLANSALVPREIICRRVEQGIHAVVREEFHKPSPYTGHLLLWLDLPNVLFGRQGDPWAMLAQVSEMVDG